MISARRMVLAVALVATLLCLLARPSHGLVVRVASSAERCFSEPANAKDKVLGNLRVMEGGSKDIDLRISDPHGKTVLELTKVRDDSFQFYAKYEGPYTICFGNTFSHVTGKTVSFNLYVGTSLARKDAAKSGSFSPLEQSVNRLAQSMREVNDWSSYMKSRERMHHRTVESTNFRITLWRIIQISTLVVIAAAKIWYLRSMFESKRGA